MKEIHTNIFVGDDTDCEICTEDHGFSIVHACQTCHYRVQGGPLPSSAPGYLTFKKGHNLYLNLLDSLDEPLPEYAHPIFINALDFIHKELKAKKVLIHCNYGYSRSPSIGLAYLSAVNLIPNDFFEQAAEKFSVLYPKYAPGRGIALYLRHNWDFLVKDILKLE